MHLSCPPRLILLLALLCLPSSTPRLALEAAPPDGENTLYVIPHIHWEGAVFKTREEYLEMGLPFILKALHLLDKHPEYRFVLDQVAYVQPFLERYPEEADAFRRFVKEGRLQLVGATITMQDVNMPSGESFVRHVLYGKRYYREAFGADVTVGWGLDTFGHHAQLPQLLKLAGYNSYWFQRGPKAGTPLAFLWEGIDGSQIPAFWLAQSYVDFHHAPGNPLEFDRFARSRYDNLAPYIKGPDRVSMAGTDVAPPEEHLPGMIRGFNDSANRPFTIRFAVPTDYEAVAERGERPVVQGELNPVFQGIYSSRIEVKQWMRELERILTTTEKLAVISEWLGQPTDERNLARAWDPVLFNQAHDLASGVMVDKVFDDTMRGFRYSKQVGEVLLDSYLSGIAGRIDTRGEGSPLIVFNTLGWTRSDFVETTVGFSETDVVGVELRSAGGKRVPIQLDHTRRYADGGIQQAKISFVARDVPALGYTLFHVIPRTTNETGEKALPPELSRWAGRSSHQDEGSIENELYRLTFQLWTGEIKELLYKPENWNVLGQQPGNIVAMQHDGGDFWELDGTLNGARLVAMEKKQPLPTKERARFSTEQVGGGGRVTAGPVFSQFSVDHPLGSGSFATRVRIYTGLPRIDFQTRLVNNEKFARYRVLFPTSIRGGKAMHEIPFGAIERPRDQEFPAQNWIDYSGGGRGVALLNRGLPGNNVASDTLMLSLARSARIQAYAFHGGFEPGVGSDSGLEVGKSFTFDYALLPHLGDWREAHVYRAGWELNHPLLVRKLPTHRGDLPPTWSLASVSKPNVVLSAAKPGPEGSAVLRVYEAAGENTAGVEIRVSPGVSSAHLANLIEDSLEEIPVENGAFRFDLGPYEIKTFRLKIPGKAAAKP